MAGTVAKKEKSSKKCKKRKTSNSDETLNPSKLARQKYERENVGCVVEDRETWTTMEVEEETSLESKESTRQWRNLDIVLAIENKELNALKLVLLLSLAHSAVEFMNWKVELVFDFVNSRVKKEDNDPEQDFNILSISRLLLYSSKWIQDLLIAAEKKIRAGEESVESQLYLDYRCWEIFKFCMEESSRLHVSLSLQRDLLRVISCVARSALKSINSVHVDVKEPIFSTAELQFYNSVSDCIKLIFSFHRRLSDENLDLWAVVISSVLELIVKIYGDNLQDNDARNLISQFSCLVFEPFAKFLRVHPVRKNGFRDFVDKLLDPLLHLLGILHDKVKDSPVVGQSMNKSVEEILSYGLFHSVHLDEYLSIHSTEKYSASTDCKLEGGRTIIKSYHRHVFDKMENLVSERKVPSVAGIGHMFQLFINCVRKYKRGLLDAEKSNVMESRSTKQPTKIGNLTSERSDHMITPSSEVRKSVFDFFVVILEPLLLDLKKHLHCDLQAESSLLDVFCALKSVNKVLSVMMHERVYLRTHGDYGGACLNFFKIIYGLFLSCYAKLSQLWQSTFGRDKSVQVGILNSIAKEFILVVQNFLEIEYEVIGDELVGTWVVIFTFLAMAHFSEDVTLFSETIDLGCRVLNLYSELRQVDHAVFTLCKGLRHLSFYQGDDEENNSVVLTSKSILHQDKFAKSGHLLLCSQKFRLAICNAIKSIPEGQVSGCIQAVADDVSDSLMWMKLGCSVADEFIDVNSCRFSAQAEIVGLVLSEIYSIVLESLSVTTGNSYFVGVSIKELIMVLHPNMSHLIAPEHLGADEFLFSAIGITLKNKAEFQNDLQDKFLLVVLFFFRLYVVCRSVYRQAVALMPPDSSTKMSGVMGDFYTAYSGQDCLERTDFEDEGYFSWIGQPSASLMSVIKFIKDNFLHEGLLDHSCLIYVMHIMTFQRLVDVKRQVQSLDYIVQRRKNVIHSKLLNALSSLKQEAADLTGFLMEYLSLVHEKQLPSELCKRTARSLSPRHVEFVPWDLGICTVNEKTLPTALWWIVCQNIDIWCNHATKEKLKLFLSLLIFNSLPYTNCSELGEHPKSYPGEAMKVSKHQISLELLCDTNLYNQRFVCRYMTSRLCDSLKECLSLLFKDTPNIDAELNSSDWTSALNVLHNSSMAARDKPATSYCTYSERRGECCEKQSSFSQISQHVAACRSLLDLLCQMETSLSLKSFSHCAMCLINFERLLIDRLLDPHGTLCLHGHHEVLGLLVSCRRALKYMLMGFCEVKSKAGKSLNLPLFSGSSSSTLWLLKSVNLVVAWRNTLSSENNDGQVNNMIFSLMDHTSYVFFTLCKYQFGLAIHSIMRPSSAKVSCPVCVGNLSHECACMRKSKDNEACESVTCIAETFEEQTKSFLVSLRESFGSESVEVSERLADLNKLSSVISCIQGFLWGLESTLNDIHASTTDLKAKLIKRKHRTLSGINSFIDTFLGFIGNFSRTFVHNDQPLKSQCDGQEGRRLYRDSNDMVTEPSLSEGHNYSSGTKYENQDKNSGPKTLPLGPSDVQYDTDCSNRRLQAADGAISVLTEFGSFNHNCLRVNLLQSCLYGQNLEAAFFLRELFIASSAIMKLSIHMGCSPLPSDLIQILMGCAEVLLEKFACMGDTPKPSSVVWLDGTLKFLETLGSQLLPTGPDAAGVIYTKLVELHLKAIGRCISLQGKEASLASHDVKSSTKVLSRKQAFNPLYGIDELKTRLRMSFKVLTQDSSEEHLLCAVQAIERALVGVQECCSAIYEVKRESAEGGLVSSIVAAGVDCLDSVLEFVKGKKRLDLVKSCINNLIAALFNIIVHLQGPKLFYRNPNILAVNKNPDSGSVVLMCVEVLTRVVAKPALFYVGSNYVGQSMHIVATLFRGFRDPGAKKSSSSCSLRSMDSREYEDLESCFQVDRQFSINLYAASCRLLWTVVKHHKSECVRCIALLQVSLQSLLHCLEIVDGNSADRKGCFSWRVEEGVKCASYLRRVYEEIRQQKDVLGQQCFMFLSDYIWLYSGLGPLKQGIKREVDEALKPGIYALVDVCSPDDLQYLHTVFGGKQICLRVHVEAPWQACSMTTNFIFSMKARCDRKRTPSSSDETGAGGI
ncbi:hypothetical protein Cgig2_001875 [Carnegiea gigantea]|uniref:Nucleolar 27S pre-rRNA processing Urb2/Npa2 C-terminal domain-containing protein n=1 Tax=Carnegiea gigantea TaxID=171969 RepID=A0A9Q1JYU3_9CARY|nr:hypothetical protein Cgig2_001875 [Carnegiea gigantea]